MSPVPLITDRDLKDSYDVIIVGSGAGGGQAAYTLTLEGAKVLLLEAGAGTLLSVLRAQTGARRKWQSFSARLCLR
jgi:choline dehydrogenase-like flavoprotein